MSKLDPSTVVYLFESIFCICLYLYLPCQFLAGTLFRLEAFPARVRSQSEMPFHLLILFKNISHPWCHYRWEIGYPRSSSCYSLLTSQPTTPTGASCRDTWINHCVLLSSITHRLTKTSIPWLLLWRPWIWEL